MTSVSDEWRPWPSDALSMARTALDVTRTPWPATGRTPCPPAIDDIVDKIVSLLLIRMVALSVSRSGNRMRGSTTGGGTGNNGGKAPAERMYADYSTTTICRSTLAEYAAKERGRQLRGSVGSGGRRAALAHGRRPRQRSEPNLAASFSGEDGSVVTTDSSDVSDVPPPPTYDRLFPSAVTPAVMEQLRRYVGVICGQYRGPDEVPYHSVEHAYHVFLSANKLLDMMLCEEPDEDYGNGSGGGENGAAGRRANGANTPLTSSGTSSLFPYRPRLTYGLKSDPLSHVAYLFSALVHDVDHTGISNRQLVLEMDDLALLYNDQSVAEQRSLAVAFTTLKQAGYTDLRDVLFGPAPAGGAGGREEFFKFRKLVIDLVLVTDIASPERAQLVKSKWKEAFGDMIVAEKAEKLKNKTNGGASNSNSFTRPGGKGGGSRGGSGKAGDGKAGDGKGWSGDEAGGANQRGRNMARVRGRRRGSSEPHVKRDLRDAENAASFDEGAAEGEVGAAKGEEPPPLCLPGSEGEAKPQTFKPFGGGGGRRIILSNVNLSPSNSSTSSPSQERRPSRVRRGVHGRQSSLRSIQSIDTSAISLGSDHGTALRNSLNSSLHSSGTSGAPPAEEINTDEPAGGGNSGAPRRRGTLDSDAMTSSIASDNGSIDCFNTFSDSSDSSLSDMIGSEEEDDGDEFDQSAVSRSKMNFDGGGLLRQMSGEGDGESPTGGAGGAERPTEITRRSRGEGGRWSTGDLAGNLPNINDDEAQNDGRGPGGGNVLGKTSPVRGRSVTTRTVAASAVAPGDKAPSSAGGSGSAVHRPPPWQRNGAGNAASQPSSDPPRKRAGSLRHQGRRVGGSLSMSMMTPTEMSRARRPRAHSEDRRLGVRRALDLSGSTILPYGNGGGLRSSANSNSSGQTSGGGDPDVDPNDEPDELRATVVLEQMMRAADVGALLQDWDNMMKWSTRLYGELMNGFLAERGEDPRTGWHENQIKFFDFYILPLAKNLGVMRVFDEGDGDTFVYCVKANLARWIEEGTRETELMMRRDEEKRRRAKERGGSGGGDDMSDGKEGENSSPAEPSSGGDGGGCTRRRSMELTEVKFD